jgi:hypothetical protein
VTTEPIHHVPLRPEYKSPFSAAFAIEAERLVFFSGCATVPPYHVHPHDPEEERQWLKGDFREQTERTCTKSTVLPRWAASWMANTAARVLVASSPVMADATSLRVTAQKCASWRASGSAGSTSIRSIVNGAVHERCLP